MNKLNCYIKNRFSCGHSLKKKKKNMSMKNSHEGKNSAVRAGDLKLMRANILDLPYDTVAQSVEHRHDKPKAMVRIPASVRFFICSVAFFPLF